MHGHQRAEGGLAALNLFASERLRNEVHTGTPVLLGDHHPEQPELRYMIDDRPVESVIPVVLHSCREHPVIDEPSRGLLQVKLLVSEGEINHEPRRPPSATALRPHRVLAASLRQSSADARVGP